ISPYSGSGGTRSSAWAMETARDPRLSHSVALISSPLIMYSTIISSGSQIATYPAMRAPRSRFASVSRFRKWMYASRVRGRSVRLCGNRWTVEMGIGRGELHHPKYHHGRDCATLLRGGRVLIQLLLDVHLRDGADDLVDHLAVLEEQEHRDRAHVEA